MSAVVARIPGSINSPRVQAQLVLLGSSFGTITLPITSPQATYDNLEGNWQEVPRPGLKPINQRVGGKLRTAQYTVTVVDSNNGPWDLENAVEPKLARLATICNLDSQTRPVAMVWGGFDANTNVTLSGHWHIDSMQVVSEIRQPGTNNVSQATVTFTLKEASDLTPLKIPSTAASSQAPSKKATASVKTYTVKSGDTLYGIALKVYGNDDTSSWRKIATANGIGNPQKLQVGQVLKIP